MTAREQSGVRIESLTFFRFIAALVVIIFHFGKEATGFSGALVAGPQMVTFFFCTFRLCYGTLLPEKGAI
jgi:peptidoglycan/LPS O-acetylase OafA/YrhL